MMRKKPLFTWKTIFQNTSLKIIAKETIGVFSKSPKGWKKELNLISWNDKDPKYDIREWSPDHIKMGKGVTLTAEELKKLSGLLNGMNL